MSIYGTWLSIEAPSQFIEEMEEAGIKAGLIGDFSESEELGSPIIYQGSHVLPQESDPRGGSIDVAAIPSFITRDGQDNGKEGPKDFIRLSVEADKSSHGEGVTFNGNPYSVVVLDKAQVVALKET